MVYLDFHLGGGNPKIPTSDLESIVMLKSIKILFNIDKNDVFNIIIFI